MLVIDSSDDIVAGLGSAVELEASSSSSAEFSVIQGGA